MINAPLSGEVDNTQESYTDYWSHIELGAANYGEDGHTQASQSKTVFMELKNVTSAPNYFSHLPSQEGFSYVPQHQYDVLFLTLDKLVAAKGEKGIFHVNDLFTEYTEYAVMHLKNYAKNKGYDFVIIEPVIGDYTKIVTHETLSKYNKIKYDSVHLKNPEVSFYNFGIDGSKMLSDDNSRQKARDTLQLLANLSCHGLFFFPINHSYNFIPKKEYEQYIEKGQFYKTTTEWSAVGYHFPEGKSYPVCFGAVYFIASLAEC